MADGGRAGRRVRSVARAPEGGRGWWGGCGPRPSARRRRCTHRLRRRERSPVFFDDLPDFLDGASLAILETGKGETGGRVGRAAGEGKDANSCEK